MTYQARQREPLMDDSLREALRRRGREILGLALLGAGLVAAAAVGTYSAEDSGLLTSNGSQTQNLLGSTGAEIVSVSMVTIGLAVWCFPAFLILWGLRYLFHFGGGRMIRRLIFLPILALNASVVAAALPAPAGWPHHFGAGGMLGDTMFGALTYIWPAGIGDGAAAVTWLSTAGLVLCAGIAHGATGRGAAAAILRLLRMFVSFAIVLSGISRLKRRRGSAGAAESGTWGISLFKRGQASADQEDEAEWDGEDADENGGEDVGVHSDDRPGMVARAGAMLSAAARWKPKLRLPPLHGEVPARPAVEPALTRGGLMDFEPLRQEPEEDEAAGTTVVKHPPKKTRKKSRKAMREDQPPLIADEDAVTHQVPPLSLLQDPVEPAHPALSSQALEQNARLLESVLNDYGVKGEIQEVRPGPVVTLYELMPEPGLKASRVIGLADDIARNMSALSARISTVPGRNVIGIELPNEIRETVYLRELLADREFGDSRMELAIALGKDIGGEPEIVDLAQMPHLLIAGTTGSGKSVAINTMILSLLYRLPPEECRLIMIDPKMLELSVYDGIPHLLAPVVTDPKKAVDALKWVVAEMEERYRMMSKIGVRKLTTYNERVREAERQGKKLTRRFPNGFDENGDQIICEEESEARRLPYIVVIVDEMADLMMVAGKEIEACIQRLAQMARASGIHVVMATQRPSVDVITGTVKANFPSRVSFQVTSKIDSRTILGEQGAEQLLGRGDMLYMSGGSQIGRVHGPFVTDEEVESIVNHLKEQGEPDYLAEVLDGSDTKEVDAALGLTGGGASADSEYEAAVQIVLRDRKCSTSYIQRKMEIGYNKAARIVERMESEGLISAANHVGKREILVPE